ncbi:MAG: NADH-quinone oxidoreductase subunit N [Vulcanimicrobiota bacterium]
MNWSHLLVQFTPELAVLVTAVWVILSDLFLSRHPAGLWRQCFLGLAAATIGAGFLYQVPTPGVELPEFIGRVLAVSALTSGLKFVVLLLSTLAVVFSYRSFEETERHAGEYYALVLFSVLGGLLCISSQDLVLFFISFELLSLPLYMLCGFRRYNSASAEAGLKYFVNGALSSALMLYGISWIYGSLGSTHLPTLVHNYALAQSPPQGFLVGCLLVLAGLGFKVAVAPFHTWAPDVYTGAPPAVSTFLASAPKVTIIGFAIRLFWQSLNSPGQFFNLPVDWVFLFSILAAGSMFVGNLSALPQTDVRKILAYSGIAQMGYIFMGLAACNNAHPQQALSAVIFYTCVYGISNLGAWAVLAVLARNQERFDLDSLRGLHQRHPALAACLALCLMSLAGVPPLSGFMGKFYMFRAIYETGLQFLVVMGILNSVISLFYYFKVLKAAYFVEAEFGGTEFLQTPAAPSLPMTQQLAFQVCLWSNVVLGLWPAVILEVERVAGSISQGN